MACAQGWFHLKSMSTRFWGIISTSLIGTILHQKGDGNLTTVLCCTRTRPNTNSFYCFSYDKATLQDGVFVRPSVTLLERYCNAFVFWLSRSDSWASIWPCWKAHWLYNCMKAALLVRLFVGDWDKDQLDWQLCWTLWHLFEVKEPLQHFENISLRLWDQKILLINAIFVI